MKIVAIAVVFSANNIGTFVGNTEAQALKRLSIDMDKNNDDHNPRSSAEMKQWLVKSDYKYSITEHQVEIVI